MLRPGHLRRTTLPGLPLVGALVATGLGAVIAHPPGLGGKTAILGGITLLAAACFLPAFLWRTSGISSGFLYALATFLTFGLGSFAWLGQPPGASPGLSQEAVTFALVLVSAGILAFWAGYSLARPPRDVERRSPRVVVPIWPLWLLFGLGLSADLVLFLTGRFSYLSLVGTPIEITWWQQWLITLGGLTGLATNIACLHAFGSASKPHRLTVIAMLSMTSALGFVSGYKGLVILPLIWALFIFYYYRRRLPRKLLAPLVVAILVLVPANLSYRDALTTGISVQESSFASVFQTVDETLSNSLSAPISDRMAVITQWSSIRFRNIDSVAAIQYLTPSRYPYLGVQAFGQAAATTLVPRLLWPGKPSYSSGVRFGIQYLGVRAGSQSSTPITHTGDLYLHAGMVGVVAGMAIWGVIASLVFRWLRRRESPQALVIYVAAISVMVQTELNFANVIAGGFKVLFLAWAVCRLLYGPMPIHAHETRASGPHHEMPS